MTKCKRCENIFERFEIIGWRGKLLFCPVCDEPSQFEPVQEGADADDVR